MCYTFYLKKRNWIFVSGYIEKTLYSKQKYLNYINALKLFKMLKSFNLRVRFFNLHDKSYEIFLSQLYVKNPVNILNSNSMALIKF